MQMRHFKTSHGHHHCSSSSQVKLQDTTVPNLDSFSKLMPGSQHILAQQVEPFRALAISSEKTLRLAKANQPSIPAPPRIPRNMTSYNVTSSEKARKSYETSAASLKQREEIIPIQFYHTLDDGALSYVSQKDTSNVGGISSTNISAQQTTAQVNSS